MHRVTAAIVTRGDVDLSPILDSFPDSWHVEIWNNADGRDLAVWGRYVAARRPNGGLVYVQDDDCVLPASSLEAIVDAHRPGRLVSNMPEPFRHDFYVGHCLVGFGAVFEPALVDEAFARFWRGTATYAVTIETGWFRRTCDIAFTGMVDSPILVDLPYRNLPWATDETRMYRQPDHVGERKRMIQTVARILS